MFAIIFTGLPASGKDTQVNLLSEWLKKNNPKIKFKIIRSSEELFKFFKKCPKKIRFFGKTYFKDKEIKKFYSGKLVSFGFVSYLIKNKIEEAAKEGNSLIISGSPRSRFEARVMLKILKKYYKDNFILIFLKVSEKTVYERALKRKRKEGLDEKEKIKIRIQEFKKNIWPAILIFKKENKLLQIDGEPSIKKIHKNIIKEITKKLEMGSE
jgi:adenylate kinase family enzyme